MPINLQGSGNIAEGWGPPPQLQGRDLGTLVHSILQNRLARDKMTQESIADTIKNVQAQRHEGAYAEALRNAGLTQGQDVSGLSEADATRLVAAIQAQTPDTQRDALLQAQAAYYNRSPSAGRGGVNQEREARIRADEEFKRQQAQNKILGTQASDIASEQEDYGLKPDVHPAAHGYVMRDGKMDYARTPEEQAAPTLVSPADPLTDPNAPTFTPDVYKQREERSTLRQKILAQQKGVQEKMLAPSATDTGGDGGGAGGQLPVGTRGRRGDTWYVKQADGSWQPEDKSQPNG